jgi:signal transduction histidine kinase
MPFPSQHYPAGTYGGNSRTWAVAQGPRGVIYLGGKGGLFAFDAERWRQLPLPGSSSDQIVRSLAVDTAGTVYVGREGDFGMMQPDTAAAYRSLTDGHPSLPAFDEVWSTFRCRGATYFQTRAALFRWDGQSLQHVSTDAGIHTAFCVDGSVFVRDFDRGLLVLQSPTPPPSPPSAPITKTSLSPADEPSDTAALRLVPVAGGDAFQNRPVRAMLPRPDGSVLVGTSTDGLFVLRPSGAERLDAPVNNRLAEHRLYRGIRFGDGVYALSTIGGGIFLVNAQGRLLRHLEPDVELEGSTGNDLHRGRDGQLWIAFHNAGLQRLDVLSSVTRFGSRHGLSGLIDSIVRHNGVLYVGTGAGLFRLDDGSGTTPARFEPVPGVPPVLDLAASPEGVLAATAFGLHLVSDDERDNDERGDDPTRDDPTRDVQVRAMTEDAVFGIIPSDIVDGRYYLGTRTGVSVLPSIGSTPISLPYVDAQVRTLTEGPDGGLWIPGDSTLTRLSFRGSLSSSFSSAIEKQDVRRDVLGPDDGLPSPIGSVTTCGDNVFLLNRSGLHRLVGDDGRMRARPDTAFFESLKGEGPFFYLHIQERGSLWAGRGHRVYRSPPVCGRTGRPKWTSVPRLHFPKSQSVAFHADPSGIAWVSDGSRLFRHDLRADRPLFTDFEPFVTAVYRISDGDAVATGIPGSQRSAPPPSPRTPRFTLPYAQNNLRVEVAAPVFNTFSETEYQVRVEGRTGEDASWTTEASETLTNLSEGTYTIRTRARTERGDVRQGPPLTFRILPPWYRTTAAYAAYALLFGLAVAGVLYGAALYRENQRRREQAQHLRRQRQRNQHLNTMNDRLREANEKLRQANELKESFLASTSHELRTPLSSILGYADVLEDEAPDDLQTFVDAIQDSGERLLHTLNRLLYLSGLRSGTYDAYREPTDLADLVTSIADDYAERADGKGLDLVVQVPSRPVTTVTDRTAAGQILRNLVDNAVKFTYEGEVIVTLADREDRVIVTVRDTGVGIGPEFQSQLFEDFQQESKGLTREYPGSGIGLAVSKRFADLIDASIEIESEPDRGTEVRVSFPRQSD